jgi:hypothetical protein
MDDSFFTYVEQLELMAFFSGYPLLYALVAALFAKYRGASGFQGSVVTLLPISYAVIGTLFLGLQLKNLYPDYSLAHIQQSFQLPLLKIWALLAMLFWLPVFRKKTIWSLLHSMVFFFLLIRDFIRGGNAGRETVKNDMRIYTDSLLLHAGVFAVVAISCYLLFRFKFSKK